MIFSDRILFLHVPKAGGTSIGRYLLDLLPKPVYYSLPAGHEAEIPVGVTRFAGVAHETLEESRLVLESRGRLLQDFPVIVACIRNPYELEVSRYCFLRRDLNGYNHGAQQAVALLGNFELFAAYSRPHGQRPIETYFLLEGAVPPNLRIVRLENIDADLARCLAAAGIDAGGATRVPHLNRSEHDSYRSYYTPAAEDAVYQRYKWVFNAGLYDRLRVEQLEPAIVEDGEVLGRLLGSTLPNLEKSQDEFGLANAWLAAAEIHRHAFRNSAELEALQRSLTHAQRAGSLRLTHRVLVHLAQCFSLSGSQTVEDGIAECRQLLQTQGVGEARLLLAELLAAAGRFEDARDMCEQARAKPPADDTAAELLADAAAASVELLAGNAKTAAKLFQHGCPCRPITLTGDYGESLYRLGRYAAAERRADFLEANTPTSDIKAHAQWRRIRAKILARAEKHAEAYELARTAVSMIARCDAPTLHADALVDLAEVLERANRTSETIAVLDEAVRLYDRKGNVVSARNASALLRALEQPLEPTRFFARPDGITRSVHLNGFAPRHGVTAGKRTPRLRRSRSAGRCSRRRRRSLDVRATGRAEPWPHVAVVEQPFQRAGQRLRVALRRQQSRPAVEHHFGDAAVPGADDREATSLCFD